MDDLKIFIGGQWRHGSGNPMQSHFPADGTINAALNAASLASKSALLSQIAGSEHGFRSAGGRPRELRRFGKGLPCSKNWELISEFPFI